MYSARLETMGTHSGFPTLVLLFYLSWLLISNFAHVSSFHGKEQISPAKYVFMHTTKQM